MKMAGTKIDRIHVYETDLPNVSKKQGMKSSASVCKSLVDLGSRDNCNNVVTEKREPKVKTPLLSSRHLCINPETMGTRFPLKLSSVLNIGGKEVTVLGLKIMRKSPVETIKSLNNLLIPLGSGFVDSEKNRNLLSKNLKTVKDEVFADRGESSSNHNGSRLITTEMIKSGCLANLIKKLSFLGFEDRKLVAILFCNLMRRQAKPQLPLVKYLKENIEILLGLISGYEEQPKALSCGIILRDCLRYESLARIVLESEQFYDIFNYLHQPAFEISSDAFLTFRELLTQHRKLSAEFILTNYDIFFEKFDVLLHSENYVTQFYSLKLLTDLLLDRHNYSIMTKYVSQAKKLKNAMIIMSKSTSKNIQFEAFHAFKIFVGNPEPNAEVSAILIRNKDRLVKFLKAFQNDRKNDNFMDEKSFLISRLKELSEVPIPCNDKL